MKKILLSLLLAFGLHANTSALSHQVAIDDLSIRHRAIVEDILDGRQSAGRGDAPYAPRVATLLHSHRAVLRAALHRYDSLASSVSAGSEAFAGTALVDLVSVQHIARGDRRTVGKLRVDRGEVRSGRGEKLLDRIEIRTALSSWHRSARMAGSRI